MKETIVVTGIGMNTPLGCGRETSWKKVKEGKSLISEPQHGELGKELSPFVRFVPLENLNGLPRIFSLALRATNEALNDSHINLKDLSSERVGCSVSVSKPILIPANTSVSSYFPLSTFNLRLLLKSLLGVIPAEAGIQSFFKEIDSRFHGNDKKERVQQQSHFQLISPDSLIQYLAHELQISGPARNVIAACATGIHSLLIASRWLLENKCDIAIAGSAESSLHPLYISGFQKMGVLSDFPCPFDRRRNGFMMGEGAGILILEKKSNAIARKAKIYAELLSCVAGSDCNHPTAFASDGSSIASVLRKAIINSQISKENVDYINLHGTGTQINDLIETKAIKTVWGKKAFQLHLSSTKSATGHLLGASGSVEAAICCLALQDRFVPPTVHLEVKDPQCDLDYTPREGKNVEIDTAISLSFGFGGPIGAAVFRKPN